ncbi:MAG: hypothetical protein V9G20_02980 [Candidatus Promineifilaceae bacterium]
MHNELDNLAAAIQATPKYRHLTPDLIRRLGERELSRARQLQGSGQSHQK